MDTREYQAIIDAFPKATVVVIGDVMLDSYTEGIVERLSVEAPVPIVLEQSRRFVLGGAANVANNVAALGAKVYLCGVIGDDREGDIVKTMCKDVGIKSALVVDATRPTTEKNRVISSHHQMIRLDKESKAPVSKKITADLVASLRKIKHADIVIFSDYAKGVVQADLMQFAKKHFGAKRIIADFKPSQEKYYRGVRVVLPNIKEAYGLTGIEAVTEALAEKVAQKLAENFAAAVVLKRSEYGMTVLDPKRKGMLHIPAFAKEVFDVTGAGDTVIAAFGLGIAAGADMAHAAQIANHAASIVVELEGTATVARDVLLDRMNGYKLP